MPMNTREISVQDPVLSTIALGFKHPGLVGEVLFPRVYVSSSRGQVLEFGKEAFMPYNTRRAPGSNTKRIDFAYEGKDFELENHALEAKVPNELVRDAKNVPDIDMGIRSTSLVMRIILRSLEVAQAALATNPAHYDAEHKMALSDDVKWSNEAGKPMQDIDNAKESIRSSVGLMPNVLLLSPVAYKALRDHPTITERFKYTTHESITAGMLAGLLDIPTVVVGNDIKADDKGKFSDVWGNNAILAYVPPASSEIDEPSYGYTYVMKGHPVVETAYFDDNTRTWLYPVSFERIPVLTGIVSGFLIQNPS